MKTLRLVSYLFSMTTVIILISVPNLKAEPAGTLIDRARESHLWIDTVRFPDSIMLTLLNIELQKLAYEDRSVEKTYRIALDTAKFGWPLPVDCFAVAAVIRNVDWTKDRSSEKQIKALTYVAQTDIGARFTYAVGRPGMWSLWGDTLLLDQISNSGLDTLTVRYWSDPDTLIYRSTTIPVKNRYLSILYGRLIEACVNRLVFPGAVTPNAAPNAVGTQSIQSTTPAGRPTEINK